MIGRLVQWMSHILVLLECLQREDGVQVGTYTPQPRIEREAKIRLSMLRG